MYTTSIERYIRKIAQSFKYTYIFTTTFKINFIYFISLSKSIFYIKIDRTYTFGKHKTMLLKS